MSLLASGTFSVCDEIHFSNCYSLDAEIHRLPLSAEYRVQVSAMEIIFCFALQGSKSSPSLIGHTRWPAYLDSSVRVFKRLRYEETGT